MSADRNLKLELIINALVNGLRDVGALEQGLKDVGAAAGKPLNDPTPPLQEGAKKTQGKLDELQATLSGLVTLGAIGKFVSDSVEKMREAERAFTGLESVAKSKGIGIGEAFTIASKAADDGLIGVADSTKALQNMLLAGFGADQATALLDRLKDAAALNRSSQMSLGEAVVSVTEGFRTESSELLNNGGVVTNLSQMYEQYAKTLGKSVDDLTQAEKAQALYNGVMADTEAYAGNAAKAAGGLEGGIARLKQSGNELMIAFGGDLKPALEVVGKGLEFLIDVAKHAAVGMNVAGLEAGALVKSLGDIYTATTTLNFDGLGEKIAANFQLAQDMAVQTVERYEKGLTPAIQSTVAKAGELGDAAKKAGAEGAAATDTFTAALDKAGGKATESKAKLADLVAQYDLLKPDNADKLALAVEKLGGTSTAAGKQVRDDLAKEYEKLTGPELAAAVERLRAKTAEIGPTAQGVGIALDTAVREQYKRLGIDADQALTGVSAKIRDQISALDSLGAAGGLNARTVREALDNMISSAKTTAELRAIDTEITDLGKKGVLSFTQLKDAHQAVLEKQRQIGVSTDEVRQAQDAARIAADKFSKALRDTGVDITNLDAELSRNPGLQALAADAAAKAADAIRLEGLAAKETTPALDAMRQAAQRSVQAEIDQAQAFNRAQDAGLAYQKALKDQQAAQEDAARWSEKAATSFESPWLATYQRLQKVGDDYANSVMKIGQTLSSWKEVLETLAEAEKKAAEIEKYDKKAQALVTKLEAAKTLTELNAALAETRQGVGGALSKIERDKLDAAEKAAYERLADIQKGKGRAKGGHVNAGESMTVGEGGTPESPRPETFVSDDGLTVLTIGGSGPGRFVAPKAGIILPYGTDATVWARQAGRGRTASPAGTANRAAGLPEVRVVEVVHHKVDFGGRVYEPHVTAESSADMAAFLRALHNSAAVA